MSSNQKSHRLDPTSHALAWRYTSSLVVICLALPVFARADETTNARPNVIVFLVDDLGYECLGANGSATFQTPSVDRLARNGIRFEQAYVQPKLARPRGLRC